MTALLVGGSMKRKEDFRFITGAGHYTDDVAKRGQTWAVFAQSPVAHAAFKSIDSRAVLQTPGMLDFKVDMTVMPCPCNPLGVKGCGEAGAIAAPAALINAITDVLGVKQFDMPAMPEKCGGPFGPPPREFQTYWSQ